ncbi:MAG: polar amino acid transport system substrate-binding protein [Paraglaciecola sp.]|jgi:polar amino acid transport system substrate-binding protein
MKARFFSMVIILCFIPMSQAKDLSVGWELWYPYQYHNKKIELVGLDIESFNAIMAQAKLKFTSAEIPWKTHLHFIKTGKIDMAMGASKTDDRQQYAYFSLPYRQETVKLFVKKGNASQTPLTSLSDLAASPYKIGVEAGYYYGKAYQDLIKDPDFQNNISEVIDLEQNVSMLLEGKLDGFLVDPVTMKAFVNKYDMHNTFEPHPVEIYSADIHLMLSKITGDEFLLNKINQAITTLKNNDSLQKINRRWSATQNAN